MASSKRITSTEYLHPAVREAVENTLADLHAAKHPFALFETYRTPQRQASLFAQGRTTKGAKVTNAGAWSSYHQYGLAADFVLFDGKSWSWDDSGANKAHWTALHKIGRKHGLEPLSWELPHLQIAGTSAAELRKGNYPALGDDAWAENLCDMIDDWTGNGAPPKPASFGRPPLSSADSDNEDVAEPPAFNGENIPEPSSDRGTGADQIGEDAAMATETFSRIQAFIDKWEGGFVNHPKDPGGATNMGITQATLAKWRGRAVTVDDVRNLSREEQRRIMKANYYDVVNGDQLPPAVAAVVYNAAVLHGPNRAGQFLQNTLNAYGAGLKVDGIVGQNTIGALSIRNPASIVSDFIAIEMAYLRALKHWPTFGKGWTARIDDMKAFALKLATSSAEPQTDDGGWTRPSNNNGGVTYPDSPPPTSSEPPTVGPIGGILGQTIGKALDGNKTNLGLIGLLLSAVGEVFPNLAVAGTDITQFTPQLAAISALLTSWGLFGKLEKQVQKKIQ